MATRPASATTKTGKPRKPRKPAGPRMFFVTYNDEGPLEIFPAGQAARLLAIVSEAATRGEVVQYKKLEMVKTLDTGSGAVTADFDDEDEDEDEE